MLPNWIIAGAPKAGTSSLFRWLVDHPEVDGSIDKETYYYVDPGTHMYRTGRNVRDSGLAGYRKLFEHCAPSARVIIESTPGYMYSSTALEQLPHLPSRPNFIFLLREPVEQLKSLFGYFKENWKWIPKGMSFRDFIATVDRGTHAFRGNELATDALDNANYVEHLQRWRATCGAGRLHIFLFEDMAHDKHAFMHRLAARMKIDPEFYNDYAFPVENASYAVRSSVVQGVNLWARSIIPKGGGYRALRRIYRAANTKPAPSARCRDTGTECMLSRRFLPTAELLEQEFGLDTRNWRDVMMSRIATADEQNASSRSECWSSVNPMEAARPLSDIRDENGVASSWRIQRGNSR